jgi:hypothetical protein
METKSVYLHVFVHLLESRVGLLEESINNRTAEFVVVRLVHFENLREGLHIDMLLELRLGRAGLRRKSARALRGSVGHVKM